MPLRQLAVGSGVFLQTDPIPGGSANPYDYCSQDPINCYDLAGTFWGSGVLKKAGHFVKKHWKGITEIAVGTVLIVGGTVLTLGLGDALIGAVEFEVAEGAQLEAFETAVHGAVALAPGGTLIGLGGWSIYRGISQSMKRANEW